MSNADFERPVLMQFVNRKVAQGKFENEPRLR
jgi:hypothetical protein